MFNWPPFLIGLSLICVILIFYECLKKRYDSIGVDIQDFLATSQTSISGEGRKFSDASTITSFYHINMPRSLVLYFFKGEVWEGGGLLGHPIGIGYRSMSC